MSVLAVSLVLAERKTTSVGRAVTIKRAISRYYLSVFRYDDVDRDQSARELTITAASGRLSGSFN